MSEEKKVEVELQLLQEVVDYLQKQPYQEVNIIIAKIIQASQE